MQIKDSYWEDVKRACETVSGIETLFGKTVLITGASGMICSSVAHMLLYINRAYDAKIALVLCGRSRERMCRCFAGFEEGRDFTFCQHDAADLSGSYVPADYVIYGAGNADPARIGAEPVETILANIAGLDKMLRFCAEHKTQRLLFISSSEIYGRIEGTGPYREDQYGYVDILNPRAAYPNAKRTGETLCAAYGKEFGLDTVIVRPGHIYGPTIRSTDSRASAQFTRMAAQGKEIVLKSAGLQLRSYVYTLDCASAILTVLVKGNRGEAYNISNPRSIVSIRELAQTFARIAKTKITCEAENEQERGTGNLMDNSGLDGEKLSGLGWTPLFDIEEGVRRTLEFYEE